MKNYIDIVNELNEQLYNIDENTTHSFSYTSNGYIEMISFDDEVLWNSDNDERYFDEEKNDYEDLLEFCKKQFNNYLEELMKYKF